MIVIYNLQLIDDIWSNRENDLSKFVSKKRLEKIRFRFDIDKRLSLYSALMIRLGVQKWLGCKQQDILFSETDNGKPFLLGNNNLNFNISHTRNAIICGLSHQSIGVDVERLCNPCYEIMSRHFYEEEIRLIDSLSGNEKERLFMKSGPERKPTLNVMVGG